MPWYKDTSLWALFISVVAVALSQLPPINTWVEKTEIQVDVAQRVGLMMDVGIPQYLVFVDLNNTGNRAVVLSNLELNVTHPNGRTTVVPADSYIMARPGQGSRTFPPSAIALKPGEQWSGDIEFYPLLSPSEEEEINSIRLEISNSISSRYRTLAPDKINRDIATVEADAKPLNRALDFFNRKFDWEKGTYKFSLRCDRDGQKVTLKNVEFALFDYHVKTLKSQADDYKYGAGVYYAPNSQKDVWVTSKPF